MLIADDNSVLQLNSAGEVVQTFQPTAKCKSLRYLALDPDGASFWVADVGDSKVYRINLATGSTTATISPGWNRQARRSLRAGRPAVEYRPTAISQ